MKKIFLVLLTSVILLGCGGSDFTINPVDDMIKKMNKTETFTVILYDMDIEGTFLKTFKHKYQVIKDSIGKPEMTETGWHEVSKDFFLQHENNMGMEIASKSKDGKVSKTATPPGYSNYIGNSEYGTWRTGSNGGSFWEFYGKYAMMSSVFNLMTYPARYSYWNDYRSNYYGSRAYYGPSASGRTAYGTSSNYSSKARSSSTWNSKASNRNFKNRVRSSTSRSTRSGSRYTRSSSRSRSFGGFGK